MHVMGMAAGRGWWRCGAARLENMVAVVGVMTNIKCDDSGDGDCGDCGSDADYVCAYGHGIDAGAYGGGCGVMIRIRRMMAIALALFPPISLQKIPWTNHAAVLVLPVPCPLQAFHAPSYMGRTVVPRDCVGFRPRGASSRELHHPTCFFVRTHRAPWRPRQICPGFRWINVVTESWSRLRNHASRTCGQGKHCIRRRNRRSRRRIQRCRSSRRSCGRRRCR